jgi:CRP/FNR family transcriptional regulator, cyclic AMP receptor protein
LALQHQTIVALLEGVDWFASLTSEEIDSLARGAVTVRLQPEEVVFREGDDGDRCFVIQAGGVKVVRALPDGGRVTLARLGPGSVFGELGMFEGERRSATVMATDETLVVGLGADQVVEVLRGDSDAALGMALTLAKRLRAANERVIEHALATVSGRVAATLLAQVEAKQAQGGPQHDVELVGTATDVARLAGAPRDSANRVLHWLENEGVISMKRGRTIVHEPAALSRFLG